LEQIKDFKNILVVKHVGGMVWLNGVNA